MKSIKKLLEKFLKFSDIKILVLIFSVFPIVFLFLVAYLWNMFFIGEFPKNLSTAVMVIVAFLASFAGIVQIVRRESPGIMNHNFHGNIAVWMGSLWVAFCWLLGILILYFGL